MNIGTKIFKKLDVRNKFIILNTLQPSIQTPISHRPYNNNYKFKSIQNLNHSKKTISFRRNNIKNNPKNINKYKLTLDNFSSNNFQRKKNLFSEINIRTNSTDNKKNKILNKQNKRLIFSGIFENINIKKNKTDEIVNKLVKKNCKSINADRKLNTLIKVNLKIGSKKKSISNKNNKIKKSLTFFEHQKNNVISMEKENFYENKYNKIVMLQNYWRKFLYSNSSDNKNNHLIITKAKIIFNIIKRIIYKNIFHLLKYNIYNISYYFHFWYNKIYLKKILTKIIVFRRAFSINNFTKKIPNYILFKKQNLSSRQNRSTFNRIKHLNTYTNIDSNHSNNISSIDNYLINNKINDFVNNKEAISLTNFNTTRKSPFNKKPIDISEHKNKKIFLSIGMGVNFINNKKRNMNFHLLNKSNDITNKTYKLKTSSNNNLNIKNKANKIIKNKTNTKIKYLKIDKINNNCSLHSFKKCNMTLKTTLARNKNKLFKKNELYNNYINDITNSISPHMTTSKIFSINKNENMNLINANNSSILPKKNKNRVYKLQKFDTCPLSIINKKSIKYKKRNYFLYESNINKCFLDWKSIIIKRKILTKLIDVSNKIKLRNIFFRKIIQLILDKIKVLILKKYFDKYKTISIKKSILLKLKSYMVKYNLINTGSIDTSYRKNLFNYFNLSSGEVINNININNYINYNSNLNKVILQEKNCNDNNIFKNHTQINNISFPLSYTDYQFETINNNNTIKIKNDNFHGILIDQVNQLTMVFNLLEKHIHNQNLKECFITWKNNTFNNRYYNKINNSNKNYKKINIPNKNRKIGINRYYSNNNTNTNNNYYTIYHDNIQSFVRNNKPLKYINEDIKIIDNISETSNIKTQISNEIIYTKKILNRHKIANNSRCSNIFKNICGLKKINKIEEREVYFNTLNINKNDTLKNAVNDENINNNNNVLSESAIKRKISKIKIEINDNNRIKKIKKGKNYINNINYKDIYKKIKNYFSKKNRKITDKKVNQTFCCLLINNQDEFNLN